MLNGKKAMVFLLCRNLLRLRAAVSYWLDRNCEVYLARDVQELLTMKVDQREVRGRAASVVVFGGDGEREFWREPLAKKEVLRRLPVTYMEDRK